MFDTYSSVWFSSIYLLLFISLIGCVVPRAKHHFDALRQAPPKTPARLSRLAGYTTRTTTADPVDAIRQARALLKRQRYRTVLVDDASAEGGVLSVSAERGYLRETGTLVFHSALVGILITVGIGGGFGYSGQKVLVEGQSFVNTLSTFDSFNPGRFFDDSSLTPYRVKLNALHVQYEQQNPNAIGQPLDFTADVTADVPGGQPQEREVKVNDPLAIGGTDMYLLGNGYAPHVTVRDPAGTVVYSADVPFLPQDAKLTSLGVVKVPDGLREQVGMLGFFYPTQGAEKAPFFSSYPDLDNPLLTLNVYTGDLGIDGGVPTSVYTLDTGNLTQLTGGKTGVQSIELAPGQTMDLPDGLGSVSLDSCRASSRSTCTTTRRSAGCCCSRSSCSAACSRPSSCRAGACGSRPCRRPTIHDPRVRGPRPRRGPHAGGRGRGPGGQARGRPRAGRGVRCRS